LIPAEVVLCLGRCGVRISLLTPSARARGWPNSLLPTVLFLRLEPDTNPGESTPWWRRWWDWAAVALALVALFLPVLR